MCVRVRVSLSPFSSFARRQELVAFVRMRADYHTGVGSRSQWAKELFPHDDQGVNFAQAFGGGG